MIRKRWIRVLLWTAAGLLLTTLLVVTLQRQQQTYCTDIVVDMESLGSGVSLDKAAVMAHLKSFNDTIRGKKLQEVDLVGLQRHLLKLPYVAGADLHFTLQGVLKVKVLPRGIIARLYDIHGGSMLLADDGMLLPVPADGGPRVIVASGVITDTLRRMSGKRVAEIHHGSILQEIHKTALYLATDPFRQALITQIYVNKQQELELVPLVDDHIILIGNADSLDYKFHKLMAFYRKGTIRTGWDTYTMINLKYSNQVICTNR